MLHDWQKVLESPVFQNGFKPMTGHDGREEKENVKVEHEVGVGKAAMVQMEMEKGDDEVPAKLEVAAS